MIEALEYPFFQRALAAGLLASIACGVIGTYVVVKQMSSIAGGLSHAAFGGVGLGYLLGFEPILGAAGFALASGAGIGVAYRLRTIRLDPLISMVWAVGMALGILFVSLAPGYAPDLLSYLFGSILFVPPDHVRLVAVLDVVIVVVVALFYDRFQAVSFDEEFAEVVGVPIGVVFQILMSLIALTIVLLIRIVGVILVIALLTIPAAIARQWSDNLLKMMAIATALSAATTTSGLFLAYGLGQRFDARVPTGPLVILLAAGLFVASSAARRLIDRRATTT